MTKPRIRIDLASGTGTEDEARDDGTPGGTATIRSLDQPANLSFATESESTARASLSGSNPGTSWTFTLGPAGSSYLLRLTDPASGDWVERELIVPTQSGVKIPARRSRGDANARLDRITTAGIRNSTNNAGGTPWRTDQNLEAALRQIPALSFVGSVAPTVDDDETSGFRVGSQWLDSVLGDLWVCLDASEGAANWLWANRRFRHLDNADGPIAHWTGAGTLEDSTGTKDDLQGHGGALVSYADLAPGLQGIAFNTGGYYLPAANTAASPSIQFTEDFSLNFIIAWANTGAAYQNLVLVDGTNDPWGIGASIDGILLAYWSTIAANWYTLAALAPGVPTLVHMRRTNQAGNSKVTFGINGRVVGVQSGNQNAPTASADAALIIGQNSGGSNDGAGAMASIQLYGRELTDAEWMAQAKRAGFAA